VFFIFDLSNNGDATGRYTTATGIVEFGILRTHKISSDIFDEDENTLEDILMDVLILKYIIMFDSDIFPWHCYYKIFRHVEQQFCLLIILFPTDTYL